jgi:hypothetical protein
MELKVNKVKKEIYFKLVPDPNFLFLCSKYIFELFLKIIIKNKISKNTSIRSNICKLSSEKLSSFGLIKARKVRIHKNMLTNDRPMTVLKFFNFFNI